MILVVDASVAIKWFLNFRDAEDHCQRALEILARVGDGRAIMVQPPHFLAEIGAVLAREKPADALSDLRDLMAVEFEPASEPAVYETACKLAMRMGQHLFDTLYHAVALHTPGATLVTADKRYYRRASDVGRIALLADFVP
ncbi:MAG: type II toxin-antitoxin system VapC family toxin [Sulfuritalea sp.]|nr:type II toxin-antitoxin system VapC family toxin [Sulfuritalea sp.]